MAAALGEVETATERERLVAFYRSAAVAKESEHHVRATEGESVEMVPM